MVLHGKRCANFENLFTTTKIMSKPFLVWSRPKTKSMLIESQGLEGIGRGVYMPTLEVTIRLW